MTRRRSTTAALWTGAALPAALARRRHPLDLRVFLFAAAILGACAGDTNHGIDASRESGSDAADARRDAAIDASMDSGPHCYMVSPAAMCGDGVCDPGCESPIECPADCPAPDGGIPCSTPTTWTCNENGTARYLCYHGRIYFDLCPSPGSCHTIISPWPAQCHACTPCNGWNSATPAIGQPFVWSCINHNTERARCVDTSTGGDCIMGRSDPSHCCVLDDICVGGACVGTPLGSEDYCPM